jgi:DNA-binding IclR family transcriptional regulator
MSPAGQDWTLARRPVRDLRPQNYSGENPNARVVARDERSIRGMNPARVPLGSVDNALQVVELLGDRPSVRVVDVAEHLGVGRSTAHRILAALLARGFVVQDAHKVYHSGPAIARLRSPRSMSSADTMDVVRAHLASLAARVGETCHVAVLEGNGTRFVARSASPGALEFGARPGILLPAHKTAVGVAMLAELSRESLDSLYPRGLTGDSREARLTLQTLGRKIQAARRNGYARNKGEGDQTVTAVGLCLRRPAGRAFAGVAICTPALRFDEQHIPDLVAELSEMRRAVQAELSEHEVS